MWKPNNKENRKLGRNSCFKNKSDKGPPKNYAVLIETCIYNLIFREID